MFAPEPRLDRGGSGRLGGEPRTERWPDSAEDDAASVRCPLRVVAESVPSIRKLPCAPSAGTSTHAASITGARQFLICSMCTVWLAEALT